MTRSVAKPASPKRSSKDKQTDLELETPYERLYNKVQENKRKRARVDELAVEDVEMIVSDAKEQGLNSSSIETVEFQDGDNLIEMSMGEGLQRKEFPMVSEEEEDGEDGEIIDSDESRNNNATDV